MHEHLSRELFRSIHKGWRNPGDLAAIAMAHLFELCPHCREEFETWRGELGEGVARDEGDYDGALHRIRERTAANDLGPDSEEARVERERREAKSRAEELLTLPDEQRLDWIRNEKDRHSGLLLTEALIEECRRKTPGYPREGYALADLARLVLHHAPVTDYAVELYALALARLANAVRVIGDLPRAEQVLGDARYFLRSQVGGNRLTRAEIDSLEGSLRIDQFRYEDANRLLLRALMAYQLDRRVASSTAVLIKLARMDNRAKDTSRAPALLDRAEEQSRDEAEPHLLKIVYHLRSNVFRLQQDVDAALGELEKARRCGDHDPLLTLRYQWSLSSIAVLRKNYDEAEERLSDVRAGFEEHRLHYEVAQVDFELARLHLLQERRSTSLELLDRVEVAFLDRGVVSGLSEIHELRERAMAQ